MGKTEKWNGMRKRNLLHLIVVVRALVGCYKRKELVSSTFTSDSRPGGVQKEETEPKLRLELDLIKR